MNKYFSEPKPSGRRVLKLDKMYLIMQQKQI